MLRMVIGIWIVLCVMACDTSNNVDPVAAEEAEMTWWIAYNVLEDLEKDNYEVYIQRDTGTPVNLSQSPGVDWVYDAYGSTVYFISDRDTCHRCYFLYAIEADGSGLRRIGNFRLKDSWMDSRNEGRELIVAPHGSVDTAFYIINREGEVLERIVPPLAYFNDPCFSPDGQSVVFRGAHASFKQHSDYRDELYRLDLQYPDSCWPLTEYPAEDTTAQWYHYHAGPPRWSAHVGTISYNSVQRGKSRLFAVSPDGGKPEQIIPDSIYAAWHDWSPDGEWLAFDYRTPAGPKKFHYDIVLMHRESGTIRLFTDNDITEQAPVFVQKP